MAIAQLLLPVFLVLQLEVLVCSIKVKVEHGWLKGELLELVIGDGMYYSFKGIPYAAAPVGRLRFKAPQPFLPWYGIRQAIEHGPICPQTDLLESMTLPRSEDCLFLNVYTPELNPEKLLSVVVFIHGGGLYWGSGNDARFGPDFLVSQELVLVTINYRLGALGFLSMDTEDVPGNAGLKDQVAALKWIQKNIKQFGGDPDNVTIMGQCFPGASVGFHVMSPMSKGLFKRMIAMSGSPLTDVSLAVEPKRKAFMLGKQLGLTTSDPNMLLEYLQVVPVEKLIDVEVPVLMLEEDSFLLFREHSFAPVIEQNGTDKFLTKNPLKALKEGLINEADILVGRNNREGRGFVGNIKGKSMKRYQRYGEMLVPLKILVEIPPKKSLELSDLIKDHYFGSNTTDYFREMSTFVTDTAIGYDLLRFVDYWSNITKLSTYLFTFSCVSERNYGLNNMMQTGIIGAGHLDILQYVFDPKRDSMILHKNSIEYRMIYQLCSLFANFAKFGDPTPDSTFTFWPQYAATKSYMDINENLTVGQDLDADVVEFWNSIYEKAGVEY